MDKKLAEYTEPIFTDKNSPYSADVYLITGILGGLLPLAGLAILNFKHLKLPKKVQTKTLFFIIISLVLLFVLVMGIVTNFGDKIPLSITTLIIFINSYCGAFLSAHLQVIHKKYDEVFIKLHDSEHKSPWEFIFICILILNYVQARLIMYILGLG